MGRTTGTENEERPNWKAIWQAERGRFPVADVAKDRLEGEHRKSGSKLKLLCPFHDDHNPSFEVDTVRDRWKCWVCGRSGGDAVALVREMNSGMTFPEAVADVTGRPAPSGTTRPRTSPETRARPKPHPEGPKGMPLAAALAFVAEAETLLWSPGGAEGLAYLTGPRCLSLDTIRAARLGWTRRAEAVAWKPPGVVIPWFDDGDRLSLVKVRLPDAWRNSFPKDRRPPKYIQAYQDRPTVYPGPGAVRPGRPLVIAEGEPDALLLGQELANLAAVATLGGASERLDETIRAIMRPAAPWHIATDRDAAGEKASEGWPARARRVRPPAPYKDWTEAKQSGVDLRRWWVDRLGGNEAPPLFTFEELTRWPGLDPEPGIIVDRPDPDRRRLALESLGIGPGDAYEGDLPPHSGADHGRLLPVY